MTKIEKVIRGLECCLSENCDTEPCNGCPYDNEDSPFCNEHLLRDVLILLRARQWISVKDRLPGCYEPVLALKADGWQYVGYINNHFQWSDSDSKICYWMPLPEPRCLRPRSPKP